ncbi:palmitoyltransferase DHHC9, putative [Plasmodium vinckei vinckei]|uniref:Palmitoyltransferase n=1 Tax=Plasmodium vinckei vinckei TaxID=54757 RepID=A0A449BSA6_PLAVN|nr:palmitoyltransferase DHHC9, putative [Plasmodium vinckei vinckei]VEV56331.1 palmitoyltransferase DHHC9, putative [Plasmodium vinckei vinckei]
MNNYFSFITVTSLSVFLYACYLYCLQNDHLNNYSKSLRIFLALISAPLFVLYYWAFVKCSACDPGYVDDTWEINAEENNIQIESRKIRNYTPNKYTICDKCNYLVRPERSHHCRTCQRCVLKMDHHCPWIGTCVGEKNLKFFFLFLLYGLFISLYVNLTIMPQFVKSIYESDESKESHQMHHAAIFISISATTTLSLALIFMVFRYIYFISHNITTIESSYTDKNPYDIGTYSNWKEVFGNFQWKWFFPFNPDNFYITNYLYPLNDMYMNINNIDINDTLLSNHNFNLKEDE